MPLMWTVVDGFTMDSKLLPVLTHYRTAAVAQLDTLRRAAGFQTRWLVIPQDGTSLIGAYEEVEFANHVTPGSWVWGYSLVVRTAGVNNPADVSIELQDEGSGQKFVANYVRGDNWGLSNRAGDNLGSMPAIMPGIFCVTDPGRIASKVANNTANQISVQLVLNVAELCVRPDINQECLP